MLKLSLLDNEAFLGGGGGCGLLDEPMLLEELFPGSYNIRELRRLFVRGCEKCLPGPIYTYYSTQSLLIPLHRGGNISDYVLLSRTQAGHDRIVKQEQEDITRSHIIDGIRDV